MKRKSRFEVFKIKFKSLLTTLLAHLRLTGLLYKEFKLLVRRKKTPILVISLPILLLIIYSAGSNAIANPQTQIKVGVCNDDPGADSFIHSVGGEFSITMIDDVDCIAVLMNKVRAGELVIGLYIPPEFTNQLSRGEQGYVTFYVDDSNPVAASMSSYFLEQGFSSYSYQVIQSSEQELRDVAATARDKLKGITLVMNSTKKVLDDNQLLLGITYNLMNSYVSNAVNELSDYDNDLAFVEGLSVEFLTKPVRFLKGQTYANVNSASFNFATIFAIVSLFTLLLLASTSVIFDKKTNYLLRIKATGTWTPTYIASKLIFYAAISFIQFLLVMFLMFLQGAVYNFDFPTLLASFAVITTLNTSIGLIIGSISESENVAILFSLTLTLPFLFLSGTFFPLEFMPDYIQLFSRVIPLHTEIILLKQASVLGLGWTAAEPLLIELSVISLFLLTANYLILKYKN